VDGEWCDGVDGGLLGVGREVAQLHVFEQALARGSHGPILGEKEG
jgi:hypothetical protein